MVASRRPATVGQVMNEAVLSIEIDQPVSEVLRHFRDYPIHHLPVVRGAKPVGMLSTADVMKLEHFLPRGEAPAKDYLDQRLTLASLLHGIPVTIQVGDSLRDAATAMTRRAVHALMVVDAQQNLIGIITTTDIMNATLEPEGGAGGGEPAGELDATASTHPQLASLARLHALEEVLRLAERYTSRGQDEQLHALLVKAIDRANRTAEAAGPQFS